MKQYTHAWLAFRAVEYLEGLKLSKVNEGYAAGLVEWFKSHKDSVIQGAWYPDDVIKDMAKSHVLKMEPAEAGNSTFRKLPTAYNLYEYGKASALWKKPYKVNRKTNLPDRCESLTHAIIDNLKMQEKEEKGSPISPTDNHVATIFFMLSHYIADAHVPMHCDARSFSDGANIHGHVEGVWDKEVRKYYKLDTAHGRFFYNSKGYPLRKEDDGEAYDASILRGVEKELKSRDFKLSWGPGNGNVWDFMTAICQHSYLASYELFPVGYDETNVTKQNWKRLAGQKADFDDLSVALLSDAVESIARVWFIAWRKFTKWERKQRRKAKK